MIMPPWFWLALIVFGVVLGTVAYLILLERKIASWVQDRVGPNRAGPRGLFQPLADGLKFFLKEDYRPAGVDRWLFTVAPAVMMIVVIVAVAVVPWGGIVGGESTITVPAEESVPAAIDAALPPWHELIGQPQVVELQASPAEKKPAADENPTDYNPLGQSTFPEYAAVPKGNPVSVTFDHGWYFQIAHLNIGVLFIIATLSLAVYGVVIGGWASNNKYSFLGGLRAAAQMISYEIPLGLCLLTVAVMFGTLQLDEIVEKQAHYWAGFIPAWNIFTQPLAFLMFLVCIHAEANRAPFDLAEAEQELVGGYHTEYSSMRFAFYFLAEYAGMITTSAVCVALFFGGWHLWGLNGTVDPNHPALVSSVGFAILRAVVTRGAHRVVGAAGRGVFRG